MPGPVSFNFSAGSGMSVMWISGIVTASVTSILSAFIGRGLLAGSDIGQNIPPTALGTRFPHDPLVRFVRALYSIFEFAAPVR
jgi:hypothetical protein